jgi:predicted porin
MFRGKYLALFLVVAGLVIPARAEDAGGESINIPDNLTWHGVTVYGVIDVDYAYQTHGAPLSGSFYPGIAYNISSAKYVNMPISTLADNGLEQSKLGLKFEEPMGAGWTAIGKIETGFNPLSGELADNCASLVRNNGKPLTAQNANGDGSRCGQFFSGPAYAGVGNTAYGTVTIGRQQSLELDAIGVYDPMGLPYAFSLIGYSGGAASGIGDTETGRWDNAIKYIYAVGPVHAAAIYTNGGQDTALFGGGYGFDTGASYGGLSADAVFTRERSAVSSSSIGYSTSGSAGTCNATGAGAGNVCPAGNILNGTVTDNEAWSVLGKYTYEFGSGIEDTSAKLSLFAGYVHISMTNPEETVAAGSTTIGGYQLETVNNQPYARVAGKILQTMWTGAKYELPSGWSFTGAYYHMGQEAYLTSAAGGKNTCAYITASNKANAAYLGNATASNCSGDLNQGSFLADYQFNKHLDVYGGISYSEVGGGLASGFLNTNTAVFVTGTRLRF